jgi:hypothetical protein
MAISREQLYQQVWTEPMTAVAKQYKVSSSFLARICSRLNVPRPPRGYWAKRKVGQALSQPPLLEAGPGHELEWAPGGGVFRAGARPLPRPPAKRRRKTELDAATPSTEHRLVFAVRPHFENVYPQSRWSVEFPRPYKRLLPDVIVSAEALERALALANVLYLGLEHEGYAVTFAPGDVYYDRPRLDHREESRGPLPEWSRQSWQPARPTIVSVGTVAFGVTVYELTEYVEVERVNDRYVRKDSLPAKRLRASARDWVHMEDLPSGRLAVRAYSPYHRVSWQQDWREKTIGELESQIESIARALRKAAPMIAERVADETRKAQAEAQARDVQYQQYLKAERARKRQEAQKASRDALLNAISQWSRVRDIETFLDDVERELANVPLEQRGVVTERLALARKMLGPTDALQWLTSWQTPEELYPEGSRTQDSPE